MFQKIRKNQRLTKTIRVIRVLKTSCYNLTAKDAKVYAKDAKDYKRFLHPSLKELTDKVIRVPLTTKLCNLSKAKHLITHKPNLCIYVVKKEAETSSA